MGGAAAVEPRRRTKLALLCAGLLLFGSGCEEAPEPKLVPFTGPNGGAPPTSQQTVAPRSVQGTWAIVAGDMDATVVELSSFPANGKGCQAGWAEQPGVGDYATNFCGLVTGQVESDHVVFDLGLNGFGNPLHYVIDGTLSERGDRIAGVHRITEVMPDGSSRVWSDEPGAAILYDRELEPGPFPVGEDWPEELRYWGGGKLVTTTVQGPFVPGVRYQLNKSWTALGGDLGEFLGTELSFEVAAPGEITVHAGPVSKTLDDRPIALTIHYAGGALSSVDAELPSGQICRLVTAP